MKNKYWVPALERAHKVLKLIAEYPGKLKLTDICRQLSISKSTLFSLLNTMEQLHWIKKSESDTYSLGVHFGMMGHAFFSQFDLVDYFKQEAHGVRDRLNESVQLAVLEGDHIVYMAKMEAPTPVQMVSGPGVRFPAHATGLGKVLLAALSDERIDELYPDEKLPSITPYTLTTKTDLKKELDMIRQNGYAIDKEEGVVGFCCAAAAVKRSDGTVHAAVSVSMPAHHWDEKKDLAIQEIRRLANRLSFDQARRVSFEHQKGEPQWQ